MLQKKIMISGHNISDVVLADLRGWGFYLYYYYLDVIRD